MPAVVIPTLVQTLEKDHNDLEEALILIIFKLATLISNELFFLEQVTRSKHLGPSPPEIKEPLDEITLEPPLLK